MSSAAPSLCMHISGYEKLTLLDFPGRLASVVFTPGCVMRCPFCHNPELIHPQSGEKELFRDNREGEFFTFLDSRRGKLDGVCITGGEPTLQGDLMDFIRKVKDAGFQVKLDTNGVFPDRVESIMRSGEVDYWAMDIKHVPDKYAQAAGRDVGIENIRRSVDIIMRNAREYEFRTTVVPGIHDDADFDEIASWIDGAQAYYLQEFRDIKILKKTLGGLVRQSRPIDLDAVCSRIGRHFGKTAVRR